MIKANELYPKQMTGPVISAYGQALKDELADADAIEDYLYGLSIQTAKEKELENIGLIVGYPRPLTPEGFTAENLLIIGSLPLSQDPQIGLSSEGSAVGGRLSTLAQSKAGFMGLGLYRQFLDKVAMLKRYGVTIKSVDDIAALISDDYELSWNENHDIVVQYGVDIGYQNLWILSQLFFRFATEPSVEIMNGESE